jgi:hypothetical protein
MKHKLKLHIDPNSPSKSKQIKTPDMTRRVDYLNSPIALDSPNSIKHRISVIKVKKLDENKLKNAKNVHK